MASVISAEQYLRTHYEPDMEFVAGRLVERHAGDYHHSRFQSLITAELGKGERDGHFRTFVAVRVRVSDEPRYRIPDVCVKALPHDRTAVLIRPDLAIDIVSSDDEVAEMLGRIGDYLAAWIPYVWVVDPYKHSLVVADQDGIRRVSDTKLATPLVGEIDFAALFQQLDEPAE